MAPNRALDVIAARERRYPGPFLPEPVLTVPGADEALETADEVEIALMLVLGTLSPLERAAFLLHDVFAFSHREIGRMLGREPAAVRQLASRARNRVAARTPRREVDASELTQLVSRFMAAAQQGDLATLTSFLTDDVAFIGDGGGRVTATLRPVEGADKVSRLLVGIVRAFGATSRFEPVTVNRSLGFAVWDGPRLDQVVWLLLDQDRVSQFLSVRNPDKLRGLERRLGAAAG